MTSDPDVIANRYRKRVHLSVFSQFMVYRVSRNGKSNVGCNQYVITDCYRVVIDNGQIEICIKIAAYMDVGTVREIDGGSTQAFSPTVANISLIRLSLFSNSDGCE